MTFIALFRGVNVGGKNILAMKELRTLLENLGLQNVKTYIRSGNAVFLGREKDKQKLTEQICGEIKNKYGFSPFVILLDREEFKKVIESNPFPEAVSEPVTLHAGILTSIPPNPGLRELEKLKSAKERFKLVDNVFYLHAPDGIGRSKLASGAERLLGVRMTNRNWRTVLKIMDMAEKTTKEAREEG